MPIRETPLHREAQGAIIREWLEATGFHYTALPLPPFSELDYMLVDPVPEGGTIMHRIIEAYAEVKHRPSTKMLAHNSYMISLHKVFAAKRLSVMTNKPVWLVIRWLDGLGWFNLASLFPPLDDGLVKVGGREDRGDGADVEPCAFLPLAKVNGEPYWGWTHVAKETPLDIPRSPET